MHSRFFGTFGGGATWAEGVYERLRTPKSAARWKIKQSRLSLRLRRAVRDGLGAARARSRRCRRAGPRNLPHPADRPRNEACGGFPAARVGPFHYTNPGVTDAGRRMDDRARCLPAAGRRPAARDRAAELAARAQRLADEQEVENLQKIYGYYYDRRMWDEVADLFADDGTIEMDQRGVYLGKARVRRVLESARGPSG